MDAGLDLVVVVLEITGNGTAVGNREAAEGGLMVM